MRNDVSVLETRRQTNQRRDPLFFRVGRRRPRFTAQLQMIDKRAEMREGNNGIHAFQALKEAR